MKKITLYIAFVLLFSAGCFFGPAIVSAHQPRIVYTQSGDIKISSPEVSQAFYDELKGKPRDYFIDSAVGFELYINLLVPDPANKDGKYSANVFLVNGDKTEPVASIDGVSFTWQEFYEPFGRDYYMKGPEFTKQVPAGKYKIEVYSKDNLGKYVLAVGQKESFGAQSVLNIYWQLPYLKLTFFKTSVLQFFLTPFGIGGIAAIGALLILLAFINYLIGAIKETIKHNEAKTLLLTSGGMPQMKDEIIKLLQKPAYDVTVAFITTAAKPSENIDFVQNDWLIMKEELGFNVEEVDIEGKSEAQVMKLLELKDIIFVEGGNTFYLLKAMRACNFEKVIRKLLKSGKVYIGVSAGSMVAGRTIKTAGWKNADKNIVGLKNMKGLGLVPFDIFVHYSPEWAETIKVEIKNPKKRLKQLKILTDDQAILVQGKEVDLIGEGEAVII
jgi:peptidase E